MKLDFKSSLNCCSGHSQHVVVLVVVLGRSAHPILFVLCRSCTVR